MTIGPDDELRVGDAERTRVTEALHDHFAQGRLTREELDERLDTTLSAKTYGDLRQVTRDLPGPAPVAAPGAPATGPTGPTGPPFASRPRMFVPLFAIGIFIAILMLSGGALRPLIFIFLVWMVMPVLGFMHVRHRHRHGRHFGPRGNRGRRGPWG